MSDALDPEHFVKMGTVLGGPALEETKRALAVERERERNDSVWYDEKLDVLKHRSRSFGN